MVDAGNVTVDVVPAEGYWAVQECGKLLQPIDKSIVDMSDIDPCADAERVCARRCSPTRRRSTTTPRRSAAPTRRTDCRDFFDTKRFPGKRAVYSSPLPNAAIECALIADGVHARPALPGSTSTAPSKKLASIKDDLVFWNSGTDSAQLMTSGEVDMILAWNGRAYAAIGEQGAKFAPAYGEVVPALRRSRRARRTSSDPELAMKLVDYMMDPARQAKLTTLIPYGPANTKAKLPGCRRQLEAFLPEHEPEARRGDRSCRTRRWWAKNADAVSQAWQRPFQG